MTYDLICIGGGSGGIATANRAAQYGAKVLLVDDNTQGLGGTCVNVGCIPKKLLWCMADLAHQFAAATEHHWSTHNIQFDWQGFVAHRQRYLQRLNGLYAATLEKNQVTHLHGRATFNGPQSIAISGKTYQAPHIVIACGGHPKRLAIPGGNYALTSDDFFALEQQPKRVAIVGSGYIAVEFASALQALGTETHLFMRYNRVLAGFDVMLQERLLQSLQEQGIHLHAETALQAIEHHDDTTFTLTTADTIHPGFSHVIAAIGRTPNTDSLNLAAAGVMSDTATGFVEVDSYQNTSAPGIYALGDVTAHAALTPVAIAAGRHLAARLFHHQPDSHLDVTAIPTVVFTHPPLGTVGLTEAEATQQFPGDLRIYETSFYPLAQAFQEHRHATSIKMITRGASEKILGLHLIGTGADEILQGFAVALEMGATKADFDRTIAIHPTSAEECVTLKGPPREC